MEYVGPKLAQSDTDKTWRSNSTEKTRITAVIQKVIINEHLECSQDKIFTAVTDA